MIGFEAVGVSLGSETIDNLEQGEIAGKTREFVSSKIGFKSIRKTKPDETITDLCIKAYENLLEATDIEKEQIDCLVLCTQTPECHGIPHGSSLIHKALGLSNDVACFDISLGCSGYVYGLSVVQSFMTANGLKNGLFFTCDPYTKIIDKEDWNTKLLFGDGASVSLLKNNSLFQIEPGKFSTNGRMGHSITRRSDSMLSMHGSNVFKFSISEVPEQVNKYLDEKNWSKDDFDLFLFHQGSKFIVDNLCQKLGIESSKVPFGSLETGNLVSSSIPFLLHHQQQNGGFQNINRVLLCGFGVGLSWATMALTNNNNNQV